MRVKSIPNGATIYFDGVDIGKTPLRSHEIYIGTNPVKQVEIVLKCVGYRSAWKSFTLKGGSATSWNDVRLEEIVTIVGDDGAEMVLIPAGEFQMGSNDPDANEDEKPAHTVYVDAFYMDIYEVTNAQYKKFVDANPEWQKDRISEWFHDGYYLKCWEGNNFSEYARFTFKSLLLPKALGRQQLSKR